MDQCRPATAQRSILTTPNWLNYLIIKINLILFKRLVLYLHKTAPLSLFLVIGHAASASPHVAHGVSYVVHLL